MKVVDLPIELLMEAPWNANQPDEKITERLRISLQRYGLVQNLVVRPLDGKYEVLSGNQRLKLLKEASERTIPCVVVDVGDAGARLLSQVLNHVHGEDDLGLRSELMQRVFREVPQDEVLSVLPDTLTSLSGLTSLGKVDIASQLRHFEEARANRLRNLQFKLTVEQIETVETAINQALSEAKHIGGGGPNARGIALYWICKSFLEKEEENGSI